MTAEQLNESSQIEVYDDAEDHAYVITVDGERAGKAVYHLRGGRHFFVHTEIDSRFEGKGLGRQLVQYALEDVRAKDGTIVPICPFFAAYIKRHPEYGEMIDHEIMERIERSQSSGA